MGLRSAGGALALAAALGGAAAGQTLPLSPARPGRLPSIGLDTDLSGYTDEELRRALAALRQQRPAGRVGIIGIASGFGLARGAAVLGAALTDRRDRRRRGDWDGSVALAWGIGRAGGIGATALVTVTSVTPSKFGASGTGAVILDAALPAWPGAQAGASLTFGNLVRWGDSAGLAPVVNGAVSAVAPVTLADRDMTLMATAGWGTGVSDLGRAPGGFAGIGLGLTPRLAVSAAWAGDEAVLGVIGWLGPDGAAQVALGLADATHARNGQRFLFSFGWRFDTLGLSG